MKKNSKENIKGNSNSSIKITSSPPSSRKSNPAINRLITPDSKTKGENYTTRLSNYTPNFQIAFSLFLLVRLISAFNNQVADCDETFNYWEPTHYLMYGWGFQTWEYSPEYGIRSYAYILIHAIVGQISSIFYSSHFKVSIFYFIRAFLGVFCALGEAIFYCGVLKKFGPRIAKLTLLFLASSAGMFVSSTAYLPSSFSMYGVMMAYGYWFGDHLMKAVTMAAFSCFLGWPFSVIIFAPMGLDILYKKGIVKVLIWSLLSAIYFLVPSIAVDYFYYKKILVAVFNIFWYNATANTGSGSQLFGVEPWTFYFKNLFLNFNIILIFAIPSLLFALILKKFDNSLKQVKRIQLFVYLIGTYLWMAFFLYLPHKEERFLFVIYPFICLLASITIILSLHIFDFFLSISRISIIVKKSTAIAKLLLVIICFIFIVGSVSRVTSLNKNYSAVLQVYTHLSTNELNYQCQPNQEINVCVGKEWYRFPSNFFIPDPSFHLSFIKSDFSGQLPKPYSSSNGTSIAPDGFNDQNREEFDRYIDVEDCHYIIDLDLPHQIEPHYVADTNRWEVILSLPFLDSHNSPNSFFRAFNVPGKSDFYNTYARYYLIKSKAHPFLKDCRKINYD